jgi:glycosyltransferase involved in cell wall biosynthesis
METPPSTQKIPSALNKTVEKTEVSIGMPVFNGEQFIHDSIDSLLNQTFTDFELIISDNASTDDTEAICRDYASRDPRIRYIRQAVNRGVFANFQFVLDEAKGKYFMWAAADDLQKSSFLDQLVNVLRENQNFVCAMSDVENYYETCGNNSVSKLNDIRLNKVTSNWEKLRIRFFRNPTSNVFFCIYGLFRIDALKTTQINYMGLVKYMTNSEIPILAQLSLIGPIASIPGPLKTYRRHKNSIYHSEQNSLRMKDRLYGFFNISLMLLLIIKHSALGLKSKSILYYTVVQTSFMWLLKFIFKQLFFLAKSIL